MTSVGSIEATADLKDGKFQAGVARMEKGTDRIAKGFNKLDKEADKADKGMNKLAAGFTSLAAAAGAGAIALKGFGLAELATGSGKAIKAFEATGGSVDKLQGSFSNMIGQAELIKKKNLADTMGINKDTFQSLAKIAQASAAKTGQSFEFMFDSIVVGTARSSKLILDNLGIIVSQKQANERWAKANKTVVSTMTDLQKKQAFTNDVLRQGKKLTDEMTAAGIDLVDPFAQARAAISDVGLVIGKMLAPAFVVLIKMFLMATDKIKEAGKWFDRLNSNGKSTVKTIGSIALGITIAIGAFGILAGVIGGLAVALPAIATGFTAIGASLSPLLAPIAAVGVAILALVVLAGVLRDVWEKHSKDIEAKFTSIANVAKTAFKDFKKEGAGTFSKIKDFAANAATFLQQTFDDVWDFIIDGMTIIPQAFGAVVEILTKQVLNLVLFIEKVAKKIANSSIGKKLGFEAPDFSGMKSAAKNLAQSGARFNQQIKNTVDLLKEFTNPRKIVATAIADTTDTRGSIAKAAGEAGSAIKNGIKTGAESALRGWKLLFDDAKKAFFNDPKKQAEQKKNKKKIDKAAPTGKSGKAGVQDVAVVDDFTKADNGGLKEFKSIFESGVMSAVSGGNGDAAGIAGAGIAAIAGVSSAGVSIVAELARSLVDAVVAGFKGALSAISSFTGDNRIETAISSGANTLFGIMNAFGLAFTLVTSGVALFGAALLAGVGPLLVIPSLLGGVALMGASLFEAAKNTESFTKLQGAFAASFDRVIMALEPFFEPMIALAGLFDMLVGFVINFADAFAKGDGIARFLFDVFKTGALILGGFLIAVATTQNILIGFAKSVIGINNFFLALVGMAPAFTGLIAQLNNMTVDVAKMSLQFRNLANATFDEATARGESLTLQEQENETLTQINETSTNVPETFKVTAERFQAIQAGLGDTFGDVGSTPQVSGISIGGDLNITILDPNADVIEQIQEAVGQRAAEQTGNSRGRGSNSGGGL